jgi:hypothetical protein
MADASALVECGGESLRLKRARTHCQLNSVESTLLPPLSREGATPVGVPRTSLHRTAAPPTAGGYHPA